MRDFFYDPGLHVSRLGGGAEAVRAAARTRRARADLTYIIGEMISELNVGHAYVGGGDLPRCGRSSRACSARSSSGWRDAVFPGDADSARVRTGTRNAARRSPRSA